MIGLVETVRGELDDHRCIESGDLDKEGCTVSMADAPTPYLTIDLDETGSPLGSRQRRCDYLFIAENGDGAGWVAPVEMKNSEVRVHRVARQLRAGASVAHRLVRWDGRITFRPVAVAANWPRAAREDLRKEDNRVRFRGHLERIRFIACGDALVDALHQ